MMPENQIAVRELPRFSALLPFVESTGFTPNAHFYNHSVNDIPVIDAAVWRLNVTGLVEKALVLSLDDVLALPAVEVPYTLASIKSTPQNLLMGHAMWKGVSFKKLLERAGVSSDVHYGQFNSINGYSTYLPLEMLEDSVLAYEMNGAILPREQGFPMRLIVPGVYDYKSPKWLNTIEFMAAPSSGHFESRGWSADGWVQTTASVFSPNAHEVVSGKVTFSGMAYAGVREIAQIELSIDDGEWMPVSFENGEPGTWTRWQIDWMPPAPGDYLVKVRATDSEGFTQPASHATSVFPNGSSAIHAVVFRVSA